MTSCGGVLVAGGWDGEFEGFLAYIWRSWNGSTGLTHFKWAVLEE